MSNPILSQSVSNNVLGETFWCDLRVNTRIGYATLLQHMHTAGLDPKLARKLAPSYAFTRAVRELAHAKLVDRVTWTQDAVTFQIASRVKVADGIDYQRLATVTLDRATGTITCPDAQIEQQARQMFAAKVEERRTTDITRLINRVLEQHRNKSAFPMKGGVWFLVHALKPLADQLTTFIRLIGGTVTRWVIYDTTVTVNPAQPSQPVVDPNVSQVQTVVVDSFQETLAEMQTHIDALRPDSGKRQVANARKRLAEISTDLHYNARIIGEQLGRLEDYLAWCEILLRDNVTPTAPAYKEADCDGTDDGQDAPTSALLFSA